MKGLGGALGVTGGIAAVGAAMKSAISSGMDFTTSLNSMQAVAGATSAQVAQVGAMARQLGNDNTIAATSSVDAAQAMLELAKGGFSVDQSMQAARGTLQLAAAAQISAGEAATIQSQALQAFGLNANQAGMAADILANSANQSSAEITDVAQALQQSGAVAHQFGLSMNDTAAAISLMANSGIQGSDAGTLLKSALLALTDQSKPAQGAMEELGLQVYDAQGKFVGLSSLFGQLQTASKNMTSEQYQAATATLFGSDAMRIAGIAAQQGKTGFDAMAAAMGKQGAAADVANAKMQGLPGAWERFKNAAQDAGLSFYDAVQGPLTKAASWGAEAIGKLVDTASNAGPKIKQTWENITAAFQEAGGPEILAMWGDRLEGVFESLWGSVEKLLPTVGNLSAVFAQASAIVAAVGIESFVEALEAAAGILDTTIVPVIQLANSALSGMHPVVVGAVAAWLGFRLVGPALAGVRTQVAGLSATATNAAGAIGRFAAQNGVLAGGLPTAQARLQALAGVVRTSTGAYLNLGGGIISAAEAQRRMAAVTNSGMVTMGRFGSAIQQIGQSSPIVARMQSAFVQGAIGADRFGRTAGVAAAAGTGLKAAGSGIASVFGGPVGLALTGAVVAGTAWASSVSQQKQAADAYKSSLESLAESQKATGELLLSTRGAATNDVYKSLTDQVDKYRSSVSAAADNDAKWTNVASDMVGDIVKSWNGSSDDISKKKDEIAGANQTIRDAMNKTGMTSQQVGQMIGGTSGQWNTFTNQLRSTGAGGVAAVRGLQGLRDEYLQQQNIAQKVSPGISELGDAIRAMGDKTLSASDRLSALKAAMDAMNPARSKTEAMAQYGEAIRKVAEAAAQGIDPSAFDQSGNINSMSEAGANLSRTLSDLAEKSAQVASTGGDMSAVAKNNEQVFEQLAAATGKPIEQIRALYDSLGGSAVDLSVQLSGAPEVIQGLSLVSEAFNRTPESKTVTVKSSDVSEQTRQMLERMNIAVSAPMNGTVTITANDTVAQQRILLVTQNMSVLNALRANPQLDLNTLQFDAQNNNARGALQALQGMHPTPEAGIIIDKLLQGKAVSMTELDTLSRTTATPQAKMEISKIMENIATVNAALDQAARARTAYIYTQTQGLSFGDRTPDGHIFRGPGLANNAQGSIRQYANGGINALEQYANGKLPNQAVVQKAMPHSLIQWAEPETGGEAFIPLAGSKRSRSTDILAAVAKIFGYALVPQDNLPSTVSGMLGSLTGGALSRMLSLTGVDKLGVTAYANGGMDAAGLRKLAEGTGASRPLTGAPYVWGGVNWGDCCKTGDSVISTTRGMVQMKDIRPGDMVLSFVDGKLEAHRVLRQWFSKRQETFKVRTHLRETEASANHPYLRYNPNVGDVEWVRLDELSVGDLLVQTRKPYVEFRSNTTPTGMAVNPDMAWLMGLILGNGNVQDTRVEVCVYGDVREKAMGVIARIEVPANKTRRAKTGIGCKLDDQHGIRMHSTWFAREMAATGLRKLSYEKRIPECVWGWDEELQRAFLTGYADTDGHYITPGPGRGLVSYSSASRGLIDDVRHLHQVLGDVVGRTCVIERKRDIFIKGKKVKAPRTLYTVTQWDHDEYPSDGELSQDFNLTAVQEIIPNGEHDTYDIEVEGSHNFIADGIVVHNSGAMSAFARAAVGLDPFGGRFSTATEASQLQSMGFTLGQGSSGDLRFGWYNGGAGGGHTAGTLPDGTNVEMGGGNGGGMLGGSAAGADSPQFTDHAFLKLAPAWTDAGTDPGGFVTRPDGTIVYQPGNGNYGATGGGTGSGSGSTTGSSGTSISSRFGSAVGAFVEGQIADVFQTLGANDSPGIVGAIADYENAQRAKDKGVDTTALKTSYENAKKESDQKFEAEKLKRKQDYDEQVRKLQAEKKATKDAAKKAEIDAKLADLKKKHEDDELAKKQEHDNNQLDAKQKYDQASKTANSANSAAGQQDQQNPVTDPGTSKPAPGQDLGGAGGAAAALASTGNQIKDAFRSGLREAWRTGQPWTDTDWIVNKESSWKPDDRNGKYFGLIQAGAEVYQAAGKSPTTVDPKEQAEVYDKYVGDRYGDPEAARAHHEANNWYDDGGVGIGTGLMAKNVLRPERVLSPRQTEAFEQMVNRNFQAGIGTDQIIAKLDQLITVVAKAGLGGMNVGSINGMSPEAVRRELQSLQRLQMMRASQ